MADMMGGAWHRNIDSLLMANDDTSVAKAISLLAGATAAVASALNDLGGVDVNQDPPRKSIDSIASAICEAGGWMPSGGKRDGPTL